MNDAGGVSRSIFDSERQVVEMLSDAGVSPRPDQVGGSDTSDRPLADGRVGQLPVLPPNQFDLLVHRFNDTAAPFPRDSHLHQLVEAQVAHTPDAVAVQFEHQYLTYEGLNSKANQLARQLRKVGVGPEKLVGVLAERSLEMVSALLGVLKSGAAYIPLEPDHPAERLSRIVSSAAPAAVLIQERFRERLLANVSGVIALDCDLDALSALDPGNLTSVELGGTPRGLAYVIYTSGSTGEPKGAMNEHTSVVNRLTWMQRRYGLASEDRVLQKTPFGFDVSVWEFFWPLMTGAQLVVARPGGHRDPAYLRNLIEETGITTLHFVPSMLQVFVTQSAPGWCPSIRHIVCSGEELTADLARKCLDRFPEARLSNLYGPTEAAVDVTAWECTAQGSSFDGVPIGRPIENIQMYVLDRNMSLVPVGVEGELHIGGIGVGRGYLHSPDLTAERFVSDPFSQSAGARLYKTGDLARWRRDGTLEYLGRNDHQVKLRGFRIELGEIEAQLRQYSEVRQAVVVANGSRGADKQLVAYLEVDVGRLKQLAGERRSSADRVIDQWAKLYDGTYASGPAMPSFVGWKSSYTGEPIPEPQMSEWVSHTVERIRTLKPRRVLEVGCGVGLLLQHLAPECHVYDATDISSRAIERLRAWTSHRQDLKHVNLKCCSALDMPSVSDDRYDTVILNSVVQYFPDTDYLRAVLAQIVSRLAPSGHIFIGDVRHFGLLRVFHSSVQLAKAPDGMTVGQLKDAVIRAMDLEKELVVSPEWFVRSRALLPSIGSVQVHLKRGHSDNELTRYRYDVVLQASPIRYLSVSRKVLNVGNRRLSRDLIADRLIFSSERTHTAQMLRNQISATPPEGEDPEVFWRAGEDHGSEVRISWAEELGTGNFNVEYVQSSNGDGMEEPGQQKLSVVPPSASPVYASDPFGKSLIKNLVSGIRDRLRTTLPSYMIPAAFVVLETFPVSQNGKLDRRALPAPRSSDHLIREYQPPVGRVEELIASIWVELLHIDRVSRLDNFFELGGHSLLAVQLAEKLRVEGYPTSFSRVLETPILAEFSKDLTPTAGAVESQNASESESIPQRELDLVANKIPGGAKNVQSIHPLTAMQRGILFHHMLSSGAGDIYVLPSLLTISSYEHLLNFIVGLERVVERHEILRTAFFWEGLAQPVQVVARNAPLQIEELILSGQGSATEELEARMKPFAEMLDLARPPLMGVQWARDPAASDRCYVLLHLHHLICDNNSLEMMLTEVLEFMQGRGHALPQSMPFGAYVAQSLSRSLVDDGSEYFRAKLADVREPTVAFGIAEVSEHAGEISQINATLDPTLTERIRAQARALGVGSAALFHAAWALVLAHITARSDVVFGSVLMAQWPSGMGIQRMLGPLINTLPLRVRLADVSVEDLVRSVQTEIIQLLGQEHVSLAVAQRCSGIEGTSPLFGALLNYRHVSSDAQFWVSGGPVMLLRTKSWTNYPLTLSIDDRAGEYSLVLDAYQPIDPEQVMRYVTTALEAMVYSLETDAGKPALMLSVLPESERRYLLSDVNATDRNFPDTVQVQELFEEQVERSPDAAAIVCGTKTLTYHCLNERADRLARMLVKWGSGPGRIVALCIERSEELVVCLLGIWKSGGAYLAMDSTFPPDRLAHMLDDAGPALLITETKISSKFNFPENRRILIDRVLDEEDRRPDRGKENVSTVRRSGELAYVLYTSGSSGVPKGVMIQHASLVNFLTSMKEAPGLDASDRLFAVTTVSFDIAALEMYLPLVSGTSVVMGTRDVAVDANSLAAALEEHDVTVLQATPTTWQMLLRSGWQGRRTLKALCGGEALSSALAEGLLSKVKCLWNLYGPTETTVWSTCQEVRTGTSRDGAIESIGRPISNTQVYILDERHQLAPRGVVGEIYIAGAGVARGYFSRPGLTAERFVCDPFSRDAGARMYRSGDLARWRPDGTIEYFGRNDQQVKLRGYRIELEEIESRLLEVAVVKETVVIAREDAPGDKRLVAYIVIDDRIPTVEQPRQRLQRVLPEYMVPSAFVVMDRLPLTPNGKLDRRALPAPEQGSYRTREYREPQGEIERSLAELWQEILNVARVGRDDNFFELGGHSLLATQLIVRVQQTFSVDVPMRMLFECPTLREFSAQTHERRDLYLNEVISRGGDEIEALLSRVAALPDSQVQGLMRSLDAGGK